MIRDIDIEKLIWVTGSGHTNAAPFSFPTASATNDTACDNLVRVKVYQEPNGFNNEALLDISLIGPTAKFLTKGKDSIGIQLIPCNTELTATFWQHRGNLDINFGPCLKKAVDGADIFDVSDGPLFLINQAKNKHCDSDETVLGNKTCF